MKKPSLLQYLTGTDSPFSLDIATFPESLGTGAAPRVPLEIVNDSGPVSRIVRARLVSDAKSQVKQVFLLMSRDDYRLQDSSLNPLTNTDIEAAWQRAFRDNLLSGSLMALSAQMDDDGNLLPFRPVFCCARTRRFFHPVCPRCSFELDLCRDDDVLSGAGLAPFSASLRRYLFCSACSSAGPEKTFYACSPDAVDPVSVKGPAELILGYRGPAADKLPCLKCEERLTCHQGEKVLSAMVPVAFYPFFLFMFEAASLNAHDFLCLVSGAPVDMLEGSLEAGRQFGRKGLVADFRDRTADALLFRDDDRSFFEVLFLKLSFLGEVAGHVLPGEGGSVGTGSGLSLDRLWVKIQEAAGYLPAFWNFKLTMTEVDPRPQESLVQPGDGHAARTMGVLWFQALLVNGSQDFRQVNEALARLMRDGSACLDEAVFGAHNIFWKPRPAPQRAWAVWEKTLKLGAALLCHHGMDGFTAPEFKEALKVLTHEAREALFPEGPVIVQTQPAKALDESADDAGIGSILGRIREKWALQQPGPAPKEAAEPVVAVTQTLQAPGDIEATLIITPAGTAPQEGPEAARMQTIIMKAPEEKPAAIVVEGDDFSTETIIMQHPPATAPAIKTEAKEPEPMDQTIVMGPMSRKPILKDSAPPDQGPVEKNLEETVIMGAPVGLAPAAPVQKTACKDEEELEETVIIKPEKK